jgi:hypothetical protein
MSLEIIDILHDKDTLFEVTDRAAEIHPENFKTFRDRVNGYSHFFAVKLEGEIVAISGIWRYKYWPDNYFRVGDRSFYFPFIRQYNLGNPYYKPNKAINSQILIPMQTEIVLKQGGIPFYSMLNHINALKRSVNIQNEVVKNKYKVIDGLYWTCPSSPNKNEKSCWQNIATLEGFENDFKLPRLY